MEIFEKISMETVQKIKKISTNKSFFEEFPTLRKMFV